MKKKFDYEDFRRMLFVEDFKLINKLINEYKFNIKHIARMLFLSKEEVNVVKTQNFKGYISVNSPEVKEAIKSNTKHLITPRMIYLFNCLRIVGWSWKELANLVGSHITTPMKAVARLNDYCWSKDEPFYALYNDFLINREDC